MVETICNFKKKTKTKAVVYKHDIVQDTVFGGGKKKRASEALLCISTYKKKNTKVRNSMKERVEHFFFAYTYTQQHSQESMRSNSTGSPEQGQLLCAPCTTLSFAPGCADREGMKTLLTPLLKMEGGKERLWGLPRQSLSSLLLSFLPHPVCGCSRIRKCFFLCTL